MTTLSKLLLGALVVFPAMAHADETLGQKYGLSAMFGGGLVGFADQDTRDFASTGGSWEARFAFGTKSWLAVEAAYVGSLQGLDALGLDSNARLLGNGGEADVRINLLQGLAWQPYALVGAGWTHYSVTNSNANTSDVAESDNVLTMPIGAGIGYRYRNVLFDLRGTYRATTQAELIDMHGTGEANLDTWSATLKAGFEF